MTKLCRNSQRSTCSRCAYNYDRPIPPICIDCTAARTSAFSSYPLFTETKIVDTSRLRDTVSISHTTTGRYSTT